MKLSIIIVNYNVRFFLEQCLHAVHKAAAGLAAEVVVVDNASTDGSLPYLQRLFPKVQFIAAGTNLGFAKACNLGWAQARGEHVLFLNPDTLVPEDCFTTCIHFLETHPDCGALGVQMRDGSGVFLKESKRAFPSPLTSFFKLTGLAALFPRSPLFGRYHLGHLCPNQNHVVDVLAGAFLWVRASVLHQTGGFDERFFMYGEDVDLSYRIQQAGYQNWYLAHTTIIHFKGESTKRGSLNYVRLFYQAMSLFVRKHYGRTRAGFFNVSIQLAIWARAALTAMAKLLQWIGLPILDALLILLSFWMVKEMWVQWVRPNFVYPSQLLQVSFPLFTLAYLGVAYYAGLYDRYYHLSSLIRSTFIATIGLLALYALLPEHYRFSRGVVVFGAVLAFVLIGALRWVGLQTRFLRAAAETRQKPYLLVAASPADYTEAFRFLTQRGLQDKIIGRIGVTAEDIGAVSHLPMSASVAKALGAEELIFCAGQFSYKDIIATTAQTGRYLKLRYHAAGSGSVVGSDASTASGEIISLSPLFALSRSGNRRIKRLIDVVVAVLFFATFPLHLLTQQNRVQFFKNCWAVLSGRLTWIGYAFPEVTLPPLRGCVLATNGVDRAARQALPEDSLRQVDFWYAHDWDGWEDIRWIIRCYGLLDEAPMGEKGY